MFLFCLTLAISPPLAHVRLSAMRLVGAVAAAESRGHPPATLMLGRDARGLHLVCELTREGKKSVARMTEHEGGTTTDPVASAYTVTNSASAAPREGRRDQRALECSRQTVRTFRDAPTQ